MRIVVLFCFVTIIVASPVHANRVDARKAFKEGVALFKEKEYTSAAAAFRESYHLVPNWQVYYNIAQCEGEATHYSLAIEAFEKYLSEGGDRIDAPRKKEVEEQLHRLRSREAYQEGTLLFEKGDYSKAALAFRKAHELNPNWKVLYNIGQCETTAKHYGLAMEAFEKYLSQGGDDISLERRQEVETELDRLERLVGYVEISAPSGAVIYIDDVNRGATPLPGRLIIASSVVHRLKIDNKGRSLLNREIQVNGRQSVSIVVDDAEHVEAPGESVNDAKNGVANDDGEKPAVAQKQVAPPLSTAAKRRKRMKPMGIVIMSTGGASIAASLIVGSVALKRRNDLKDSCDNDGCPPDYHDENNNVKHLARVGDVLFATGATLAVTGGVLYFVGKWRQRKERAIAVNPAVGRHIIGLTLSGSFE